MSPTNVTMRSASTTITSLKLRHHFSHIHVVYRQRRKIEFVALIRTPEAKTHGGGRIGKKEVTLIQNPIPLVVKTDILSRN